MEQPVAKPLVSFEFEVEKILGISADGRYQVQWAPAWVSKFHLVACQHLIEEFLQQQRALNEMKYDPENQAEVSDVTSEPSGNAYLDQSFPNPHAEKVTENSRSQTTGLEDGSLCPELPPNERNQFPLAQPVPMLVVKEEEPDPEILAYPPVEHFPVPDPVRDLGFSNQGTTGTRTFAYGKYSDGNQNKETSPICIPKTSSNGLIQHHRSTESANEGQNPVYALIDQSYTTSEPYNIGRTQFSCGPEDIQHTQILEREENMIHSNGSYSTKDNDTSKCGIDSHSHKLFFCTICPKSFDKAAQLNRHTLSHTGTKPYSCEVCGKTFAWKGNLTTHLRIHTGVKPHMCEGCGMTFSDKSSCNRHTKRCQRTSMA